MNIQKLEGYYRTGFSEHFLGDNGFVIDENLHTEKNFQEPYMVRPQGSYPSVLREIDGFIAIADRANNQYHRMPSGANWEYSPCNCSISYRHRAIALIDFDTYDKPRLLEVTLINL